jgi:hypothetical protein
MLEYYLCQVREQDLGRFQCESRDLRQNVHHLTITSLYQYYLCQVVTKKNLTGCRHPCSATNVVLIVN